MKNLITIIVMLVAVGCGKSEIERLEAENKRLEAENKRLEAENKINEARQEERIREIDAAGKLAVEQSQRDAEAFKDRLLQYRKDRFFQDRKDRERKLRHETE